MHRHTCLKADTTPKHIKRNLKSQQLGSDQQKAGGSLPLRGQPRLHRPTVWKHKRVAVMKITLVLKVCCQFNHLSLNPDTTWWKHQLLQAVLWPPKALWQTCGLPNTKKLQNLGCPYSSWSFSHLFRGAGEQTQSIMKVCYHWVMKPNCWCQSPHPIFGYFWDRLRPGLELPK